MVDRPAAVLALAALAGIVFPAAFRPRDAGANMLANPGFERAVGVVPDSWEQFGGGTVTVRAGGAHGGRRCVEVFGGTEYQFIYQWADGRAVPGATYDFTVFAKAAAGEAQALVKLEFMDAAGEKMQTTETVGVTDRWRELTFRLKAPETAVRVALTLGAGAGATILYDDARIAGKKLALSPEIRFDLARLAQRVGGFGVHHLSAGQWASAAEFANLNITHVRFSQDWSSWEDLATLRRQSGAQGIKWLLVKWAPPPEMMGEDKALKDIAGYARLWVDTVREFDRHGCRPEYLDLVNEPDYFGIPPAPYNELVKAVRRSLDAAGFRDVGIAGPGVTHVGEANARRYVDALDDEAVRSLAVWATHGWEDVSVDTTDRRSAAFAAACRARDPEKPVWYSEYATWSRAFHGVRYPDSDTESRNYCGSFTMPYAVRVYENTLALFNHGVAVPFYWCSEDGLDDRKQWGFIGPRGEKKPVYHALRALYGEVRPGSRVVAPPPDLGSLTLYAGAFLDDGEPRKPRVVVALANSSAETRQAVVRLANAPAGLKCVRADRVVIERWGDRDKGIPDVARTDHDPVPVRRSGGRCELRVTLPRDSALTVILEGVGDGGERGDGDSIHERARGHSASGGLVEGDELKSLEKSSAVFKSMDGVKADELKLAPEDMAWWQDARFGMFIHWGLYAIPARGEWVMHQEKIPAEEYAKLAQEFNPKRFDAGAWARTAKDAGMRYMVMVARHHDGFALWDSPGSYRDFTSVRTAAKRDFVKEYAEACRAAGLRVGLYYSPLDWRFPGYFKPRELADNAALLKRQGYAQVEELMSSYGRIDILWYDGGWLAHTGTDADAAWFWEPVKLNAMVRRLQPKVVINPRSGWIGDFQCDEGSHAIKGPIITRPWEKCLNLNDTAWGFTERQNLLSFESIVTTLVNVVCRGGNVLLNVGPDRDGVIPAAHVARLREVGKWLEANGEAIYGTRAGPLEPVDGEWACTNKGSRVYLFVFRWPESGPLALPAVPGRKVLSCRALSGAAGTVTASAGGLTVAVPPSARSSPVTVLALELDGPAVGR